MSGILGNTNCPSLNKIGGIASKKISAIDLNENITNMRSPFWDAENIFEI